MNFSIIEQVYKLFLTMIKITNLTVNIFNSCMWFIWMTYMWWAPICIIFKMPAVAPVIPSQMLPAPQVGSHLVWRNDDFRTKLEVNHMNVQINVDIHITLSIDFKLTFLTISLFQWKVNSFCSSQIAASYVAQTFVVAFSLLGCGSTL